MIVATPQPATPGSAKLPCRRGDLIIRPLGDDGRYVVKDPCSNEYFHLGEVEHFLLERLDGVRTALEVCAEFERRFSEPLSEEELGQFVEMAQEQGFIEGEKKTLTSGPETRAGNDSAPVQGVPPVSEQQTAKARARTQSILYWRKSLFDPDRLFNWMEPKLWFFWTRAFLLFSAASIALATVVLWANSQQLASSFSAALRWETVVVTWLVFLLVTTCHEFAHGLTCKHFGGEVREIGFLMMFFMPCFYCNVSDAWLFREKSKRLWVTLAGGYFELFIWALAVFVWRLSMPDTFINYLAFIVLSACGVQSFFNFNPLIKLDGYYLLSDWLEVPNLRQQGFDRLKSVVRWLCWGAARPEQQKRGKLVVGFGLVSWLYSLSFLGLMLVAFTQMLANRWGMAGLAVVGLFGIVSMRGLFQGFSAGEVGKMIRFRHKRTAAWVTVLGVTPIGLWLGQIEDRATGDFELRPVTRVELRAPVAGFLTEIHVEEGDQVSTSTLVARLEVTDLASRLAQKRAEVREVEAELHLLEAGPRQEELDATRHRALRATTFRDLAQEELARAGEVLTEDLARLNEKIAQRRAELEHAELAYRRVRKLVSAKAISSEQYQDEVKKYRVAHFLLRQAEAERRAREAMGTIEAEAELARRERDLADVEASLTLLEAGTRAEEIEAERAHLARLEVEVVYFETLQQKLQIKSPLAGAIATPRLKEQIGRYLAEGELICEVEGTESFEAEIALPEQEAARVRAGQRVEMKARALPFRIFSGKVDRIAQRTTPGEAQSTVTICCRFEDETLQLRPGMTGHARIYGDLRSVAQVMSERLLRVLRTEFWW